LLLFDVTNEVSAELLLEQARATLRESFGYPGFRPGQERAITSILSGRDTLVVLPTGRRQVALLPGAGADAAGAHHRRVAAHLTHEGSGRRAHRAWASRGVHQQHAHRGTGFRSSLPRSAGDIKLLYVAPERFDAGTTAERLRAMGVSLLAVDEAHCISEWGHDFRPSYLRMRHVRERLGAPPTVALTATATP
jgi:ATP-dependent DNA helicase RecQ